MAARLYLPQIIVFICFLARFHSREHHLCFCFSLSSRVQDAAGISLLSYWSQSAHARGKHSDGESRKTHNAIAQLVSNFFSPPSGRPNVLAKTDAKPTAFHCNWPSYELRLTKLSHLIGILCSSGHKSLSFSLDKVVSFSLLISPVMYSAPLAADTGNY